ncbi:hypothetical protein M422DRAFT_157774 [Sphaerobolus stellatus SS14]|nr:hypothetical protein M422DRAFT_157774 [Sphaerobolus stellatus SS14]
MYRRVSLLSGVQLEVFDCCSNSCYAFLGEYKDLTECPKCGHLHWNDVGKPYSPCEYLPIIPRLQSFFHNPEMVKKQLYHSQQEHIPGVYENFFDGSYYQELLALETA